MLSKETVVVVIATPDRRRDIPVHNKLSRQALCQIPSPQDDNLFLNDCQPIREQGILLPEIPPTRFVLRRISGWETAMHSQSGLVSWDTNRYSRSSSRLKSLSARTTRCLALWPRWNMIPQHELGAMEPDSPMT